MTFLKIIKYLRPDFTVVYFIVYSKDKYSVNLRVPYLCHSVRMSVTKMYVMNQKLYQSSHMHISTQFQGKHSWITQRLALHGVRTRDTSLTGGFTQFPQSLSSNRAVLRLFVKLLNECRIYILAIYSCIWRYYPLKTVEACSYFENKCSNYQHQPCK